MTGQWVAPSRHRRLVLTTAGVVATLTVFAVDIVLPHGYDIAFLYAVTVLLAGQSRRSVVVLRTMVGAWGLVLVAFLVKELESPHGIPINEIFSRFLAVVVLALVAAVVIGTLRSDKANHELYKSLREAENARANDRRMLEAASEIAEIGTWTLGASDKRFRWTDNVAVMHGFAPGVEPSLDDVIGLLPAADASRMKQSLDLAWERGLPFREEVRLDLPNGEQRWIVVMGDTSHGDDDPPDRLHGTVQDISRWKRTELAESAERNRFDQLTQSLPIIVWTADPQGNIDYFNDALTDYTGTEAQEILGDQWGSAVDPLDLERVTAAWQESISTGKTYDIEYRVRGADGISRWHHLNAKPERDTDGEIVRWWGSSMNVDATRRLREQADALAAERELVLEGMSEGVFAFDREWRMAYVNRASEDLLHFSREDAIGKVLWDFYPRLKDSELEDFFLKSAEQGGPRRLTYFASSLGKWLELAITPNEAGLIVFCHDVTEVKQLSEQLAQSQRLEAVGQLTGGIAHDFNNLLTVVLGGADALTGDPTLTDDSREMAELIGSAAERGAELTHRLLAFARRQPLEPRSVDVAERIKQLEPLLSRTLGENIRIDFDPHGSAPAEVDPGQFENALLNLAINARDAMPNGGTLTIEVDTVTIEEAYVTAHAEVAPGDYVAVTVSDSGIGIDAKDLGKLFDPFFTTKTTGKGSGLGLAMVWGFIKQSGGHITVYSEPDYGTAFKMYLPSATSAPVVPRPVSAQLPTGPRQGTILLAEDDDLVRAFATDRLRSKGYTVIAVPSGPDALRALETMERVDLLFTDVIMPGGMTGRQLADAVLELRPGTPVLYASGYTENVIIHNNRLDQGVKLLAKPYSTKQLLTRVGELAWVPGGENS